MSKCNTGTCLFADMCRFTEDNYDPKTCIIGNEMKRRVRVELNKAAAASVKVTTSAPDTAKAAAKKGGTKK